MGATGWYYFAPFEDDAERVLQRLREQVFRDGQYERRVEYPEPDWDELEARDREAPEERRNREKAEWLKLFAGRPEPLPEEDRRPPPPTIDALLDESGESGTHSILDIRHVSSRPEFLAVSPMPADRLRAIFGTDTPTRRKVESKIGDPDLIEDPLVRERWQGVYFTVYQAGKPHEICFLGTSGD